MKRYNLLNLSCCLVLLAVPLFIGCSDTLLPPGDNDTTNTQFNPNKITLKGNLIEETSLPDDAKVVLVWGVSATSPDYAYIYGEGEIDRVNKTFEITLDQPPPLVALNMYASGTPDTAFGAAMIVVVPESVPTGEILDDDFNQVYGAVDYSNLLYFSTDPEWWLPMYQDACHNWMKQFNEGYRFGTGLPAPDSCTFDGFAPASPTGLRLIINPNPDRFTGVNWT